MTMSWSLNDHRVVDKALPRRGDGKQPKTKTFKSQDLYLKTGVIETNYML